MYVHREGVHACIAIFYYICFIVFMFWIVGVADEVRFDKIAKSFYIVEPERISDGNYVAKVTTVSLFLYFHIKYFIKKIINKIKMLYWTWFFRNIFFDVFSFILWWHEKKQFLKKLPKKLRKKLYNYWIFYLKKFLNILFKKKLFEL